MLDGGPGDRWLIDTGHALERPMLLAGLRATGLFPRDLDGVLLTHRHSDHAGNAEYLRRVHGLRIFAHRADAAVLEGMTPPPPLVAQAIMLVMAAALTLISRICDALFALRSQSVSPPITIYSLINYIHSLIICL